MTKLMGNRRAKSKVIAEIKLNENKRFIES